MKNLKYKLIFLFLISSTIYSDSKLVLSLSLGSLYTSLKRIENKIYIENRNESLANLTKTTNRKIGLENISIKLNYFFDNNTRLLFQKEFGIHFHIDYEFDHKNHLMTGDVFYHVDVNNGIMILPSINVFVQTSCRGVANISPDLCLFIFGRCGIGTFLYVNDSNKNIKYIKVSDDKLFNMDILGEFGLGFSRDNIEVECFLLNKIITGRSTAVESNYGDKLYKCFLFESISINISLGYVIKTYS